MEALVLVAKASSRHSLFKGVTLYKPTSKWRAQISHGGRTVTLGDYNEEEEAARVFDRACICKYGSAAVCNFPIKDYEAELDELKSIGIPALLMRLKDERQQRKSALEGSAAVAGGAGGDTGASGGGGRAAGRHQGGGLPSQARQRSATPPNSKAACVARTQRQPDPQRPDESWLPHALLAQVAGPSTTQQQGTSRDGGSPQAILGLQSPVPCTVSGGCPQVQTAAAQAAAVVAMLGKLAAQRPPALSPWGAGDLERLPDHEGLRGSPHAAARRTGGQHQEPLSTASPGASGDNRCDRLSDQPTAAAAPPRAPSSGSPAVKAEVQLPDPLPALQSQEGGVCGRLGGPTPMLLRCVSSCGSQPELPQLAGPTLAVFGRSGCSGSVGGVAGMTATAAAVSAKRAFEDEGAEPGAPAPGGWARAGHGLRLPAAVPAPALGRRVAAAAPVALDEQQVDELGQAEEETGRALLLLCAGGPHPRTDVDSGPGMCLDDRVGRSAPEALCAPPPAAKPQRLSDGSSSSQRPLPGEWEAPPDAQPRAQQELQAPSRFRPRGAQAGLDFAGPADIVARPSGPAAHRLVDCGALGAGDARRMRLREHVQGACGFHTGAAAAAAEPGALNLDARIASESPQLAPPASLDWPQPAAIGQRRAEPANGRHEDRAFSRLLSMLPFSTPSTFRHEGAHLDAIQQAAAGCSADGAGPSGSQVWQALALHGYAQVDCGLLGQPLPFRAGPPPDRHSYDDQTHRDPRPAKRLRADQAMPAPAQPSAHAQASAPTAHGTANARDDGEQGLGGGDPLVRRLLEVIVASAQQRADGNGAGAPQVAHPGAAAAPLSGLLQRMLAEPAGPWRPDPANTELLALLQPQQQLRQQQERQQQERQQQERQQQERQQRGQEQGELQTWRLEQEPQAMDLVPAQTEGDEPQRAQGHRSVKRRLEEQQALAKALGLQPSEVAKTAAAAQALRNLLAGTAVPNGAADSAAADDAAARRQARLLPDAGAESADWRHATAPGSAAAGTGRVAEPRRWCSAASGHSYGSGAHNGGGSLQDAAAGANRLHLQPLHAQYHPYAEDATARLAHERYDWNHAAVDGAGRVNDSAPAARYRPMPATAPSIRYAVNTAKPLPMRHPYPPGAFAAAPSIYFVPITGSAAAGGDSPYGAGPTRGHEVPPTRGPRPAPVVRLPGADPAPAPPLLSDMTWEERDVQLLAHNWTHSRRELWPR